MNNSVTYDLLPETMVSSMTTMTMMKTSRRRYWRVWLFGVGGAVVACVGIVCNAIAIAILAKFRGKSSAPFLLICLAASDCVYLLALLVQENLTQLCKAGLISSSYNKSSFIQHLYSKMYPVHYVTQTLSAYIVAVITLERYVVVCLPFKAKRICSMKSARAAMVGIVLFSVTFHIPTYMAFTSGWRWNNDTGEHTFRFYRNEFGNSYFYTDIYFKWMHMVVNFLFPLAVLLVFNTFTVRSLRKTSIVAVGKSTHSESEHRLTVMIVCMIVIFFLCELMASIGQIIASGYNAHKDIPDPVNRYLAVADVAMMVNAALNFVIYCVTGRKFRETFKKMIMTSIRWCKCRSLTRKGRAKLSQMPLSHQVSKTSGAVTSQYFLSSSSSRQDSAVLGEKHKTRIQLLKGQ